MYFFNSYIFSVQIYTFLGGCKNILLLFINYCLFSGGLLYAISPFDIPGPVDDVAVLGAGSLFTLGLAAVKALRANPGVLLPFIAAAIYWLLPNIPGPVDDLLVLVISGGFSIRSARRDGLFLPRPGDEELCPGIEQDVHDGVAADVDQD